MIISKRIVLHFPPRLVDRPIIYRLVKDYDLEFNILKAMITPEEEGLLVMEMKGEQEDYDKGFSYLVENGVRIQSLSQDITRNELRCTQCGACITICPTSAFAINQLDRKVIFYNERCIACGVCIKACPPRAMEVHL